MCWRLNWNSLQLRSACAKTEVCLPQLWPAEVLPGAGLQLSVAPAAQGWQSGGTAAEEGWPSLLRKAASSQGKHGVTYKPASQLACSLIRQAAAVPGDGACWMEAGSQNGSSPDPGRCDPVLRRWRLLPGSCGGRALPSLGSALQRAGTLLERTWGSRILLCKC